MSSAARALAIALAAYASASVCARATAETLEEAWQLAVQRDDGLAASEADVESALATERAVRGARRPSVTASAGYTRFADAPEFRFGTPAFTLTAPIFLGDDYVSGDVQMKVPLYTGGRISNGIEAARRDSFGASAAERVARSNLRLDVAESYIAILRAQRMQSAAEASVVSLTAHARDVELMVERELVARSDLLAARVALANASQQRISAANGVALAYASYNRRLGEPLDRTPDLDDAVPADATLPAQPLETLVQQALEARGELGALGARADALDLQSEAERAQRLPQIAFSAGYTYFENDILDREDFSHLGIGVTWNLFDGGAARNRSAALRSASVAAGRRVEGARTQIHLDVRRAWLDAGEARARTGAVREAVEQAAENVRISRELYATGLGTNTQVLDAVTLQVTATANRDNAALDESLTLLRLAHAVGAL